MKKAEKKKLKICDQESREKVGFFRKRHQDLCVEQLSNLLGMLQEGELRNRFKYVLAHLRFVYGDGPVYKLRNKLADEIRALPDLSHFAVEKTLQDSCDVLIEACNDMVQKEGL